MHPSRFLPAVLAAISFTSAYAQQPAAKGSASATLTVTVTILPTKADVARAATMVLDADGVQRKLTEDERVRIAKEPSALRELVKSPSGAAVLHIDY